MVRNIKIIREPVNVIILLGCLAFVFLGLYIYLFKGAPLQLTMLVILFFGMGAVVSVISLISKRESWAIDEKKLSKNQSIVMSICGIIFSICSLWVAVVFQLNIILRIILFIGFVSIGRWSIVLLIKQVRKDYRHLGNY